MKKAMMVSALALLAGCATKEMKSTPFYEGGDVTYTGRQEDRVNAWPIVYWREPVGSVLWPLISFSDDHFALRPLYSQYEADGRIAEMNFLYPLIQIDFTNRSSRICPVYSWCRNRSLLTPLFYWNSDGTLLTPLYGEFTRNGTTNLYVTPLYGEMSGRKNGNWLFPLWSRCESDKFDEKKELLGKETFDGPVRFEERNSHDWLVVFSHEDTIRGYAPNAGTNEVVHNVVFAPWIFASAYSGRHIEFDAATQEKILDREWQGFSGLLFLIYQYSHSHYNFAGNETRTRHQVLLGIWDWEEENGDVSLDVFPGFTYDSKTNGYTKTSLLWRLFRYESAPGKGTAVDLLFIPIWR